MLYQRLISIFLVCMMAITVSAIGAGYGVSAADATQSVKEITHLPAGLSAGRHHFMLRAGEANTGHVQHVPIIVIQGQNPGKRMLISAAVHGDELNGIRVIHRLADQINPADLSGRLVMIPGVNQPGMQANNRHFVMSGGGGKMVDLNRSFPGDSIGGNAAERYLGQVWDNVIENQADYAIDLHTQTRGTAYPLFVFSDFRNRTAKRMAYALMPEMVKNDRGEQGTLETTLMAHGVPAVTLEIGEPKRFQPELINRATSGVLNVLRLLKFLDGDVQQSAEKPIVGSHYTNIEARFGGVAVLKKGLKDKVKTGDLIAILYDPFGVEIDRYHAPHSGHILAIATDPLREPGSMLARILK